MIDNVSNISSMGNPRLSIIVPVYNSENFLRDSMQNILSQQYSNYELLLINDGSTDASEQICIELAQKHPQIKVFTKPNGGICSARNFGLSQASGEYVTFCDNDDTVLPGWLVDNMSLLENTPVDVLRFQRECVVVRDGQEKDSTSTKLKSAAYSGEDLDENIENVLAAGWGVWAGFYRREFLTENHLLFDERMKYGREDQDFILRLYLARPSVILNPRTYYRWYLRLNHSTSAKVNQNNIESYVLAMTEFHELCSATGLIKRNPEYYVRAFVLAIYYVGEYVCRPGLGISYAVQREYFEHFSKVPMYSSAELQAALRQVRRNSRVRYLAYRGIIGLFNKGAYLPLCKAIQVYMSIREC